MICLGTQEQIEELVYLSIMCETDCSYEHRHAIIQSQLNSEQDLFVIKYDCGFPAGFAHIQKDPYNGHHGRLQTIYVEEAFRGNGYATEMIATCKTLLGDFDDVELSSECSFLVF